jgi:hypothetical protein
VVEDDDLPITVEEAMAPRPGPGFAPPPAPVFASPPAPPFGLDEAQWYDESVQAERFDELPDPGQRHRSGRAGTMLWLSAAFAAGLVATAIVAWPGTSVAPLAAPAAVAPLAAPSGAEVAPLAAPAGTDPALVAPLADLSPSVPSEGGARVEGPAPRSIVIESDPPGATIMLVDASGARAIGTTPLPHPIASIEPFEIMVTLAGHRSTVVTVDPSAGKRVSIELAATTAVAVAEDPQPAATAARAGKPVAAKPVAAKPAAAKPAAAKPAPRVARAEPVRARPIAARPTGSGTLMLGAKPPCDIFIDGKKTGLKTPQRALAVSPGTHRITLVNREHRITETFSVDVKAGASTKIVKDLTGRMK